MTGLHRPPYRPMPWRKCKTLLDSGFHAVDSGFLASGILACSAPAFSLPRPTIWTPRTGLYNFGFRNLKVCGIPDSLSRVPDSKARFQIPEFASPWMKRPMTHFPSTFRFHFLFPFSYHTDKTKQEHRKVFFFSSQRALLPLIESLGGCPRDPGDLDILLYNSAFFVLVALYVRI